MLTPKVTEVRRLGHGVTQERLTAASQNRDLGKRPDTPAHDRRRPVVAGAPAAARA